MQILFQYAKFLDCAIRMKYFFPRNAKLFYMSLLALVFCPIRA